MVTGLAITGGVGRTVAPPGTDLDELCRLLGVDPDGAAAVVTRRSTRFTYAFSQADRIDVIVKVGPRDDRGLQTERAALERLDGRVGSVLVPRLRWHGVWHEQLVVATDAFETRPTARDIDLDEALAVCLALAGVAGDVSVVHGDLAPWNLLRTSDGIALVDWESGRFGLDPLFDLTHFVVSTGALLGAHSPSAAVALLTHPGSRGWRYLEALDVDPEIGPDRVRRYLRRMTTFGNEASRRFRAEMLALLPDTPSPPSVLGR